MKLRNITLVVLALLIVTPSALAIFDPLEFHNPEKGSKSYGKYIVDSPILGTDKAEIELIENTDKCFTDCYALFRIHPYEKIPYTSKDFGFYFLNKQKSTIDFDNFICEIRIPMSETTYRDVCNSWEETETQNGTIQECVGYEKVSSVKNWYDYKEIDCFKYNFPVDQDTYFRIRTDSKPRYANIEWIPKFYGYDLNKWAWWNSSYDYRRNITSDTSSYDLAMAINGTDGFDDTIIWFNPSQLGGDSYLYYDNTSVYAVANDTDEANYETEGGGLNNSITDVYSSDAVAIWHFGSSGDYKDATSNNFDLTNNGTTFNSSTVYGGGLTFNGTDYLSIPSEDTGILSNLGKDDFTINLWVKHTNLSSGSRYIYSIKSGTDLYGFYTGVQSNKARICLFDYPSESYSCTNSDTSLINDSWAMITFVREDTTNTGVKIYLNASLDKQGDGDYNISRPLDGNDLFIGIDLALMNGFEGIMDEVRIYNRSLSVNEIEALYNNYLGNNNLLGSEENQSGGNTPPSASLNTPSDGAVDQATSVTLNVTVTDVNLDTMNVSFYDDSDDSQIGTTQTGLTNGSSTSVTWSGLTQGTTYEWYVNVTDGTATTKSSVWNFTVYDIEANLTSVSCGSTYTGSTLLPDISVDSPYTADIELLLYNGSTYWSLYNWTGKTTYSNNSITIDTTPYDEYDDYYLVLNVTDNQSYSYTNTSCAFTIDNDAPVITFDWDITNDWYSSLEHETNFQINDGLDDIFNCTIQENGGSVTYPLLKEFYDGTLYSEHGTPYALKKTWTFTEPRKITDAYARMRGQGSYGADAYLTYFYNDSTSQNTATRSVSGSTWTTKEFDNPDSSKWVTSVKLYLQGDMSGGIGYGGYFDDVYFTLKPYDGGKTIYNNITIQDGTTNITINCEDDAGNVGTYSSSITSGYTQLDVYDEETRSAFPITDYEAHMYVTPTSNSSITYSTDDESEMTGSYFIILNDSIESVRLAIGTTYYRAQTDKEVLTSADFYMYNASEYSSSQILFIVDTAGYTNPIVVKRPRDSGEDLITAEYPVGTDQEVNAYLLDSRLYNIYGYDSNDDLILIDTIMISGARTLHLTIPDLSNLFVSVKDNHASLWSDEISTDNWTIYAKGYDDSGVGYTISLYNSSDDLQASGSFSGTGTLTYNVGNVTALSDKYFYAKFDYGDEVLYRAITVSESSLTFPSFGAFSITGNVGLLIFVLFLSLGIAGSMAYFVGELGLLLGGGIAIMVQVFFGLSNVLYLFGLLLCIIGGALFVIKK